MSKEITFENMSARLVEAIPELRDSYKKELAWWRDEKPGAHNIYGDVFTPHLVSLLKTEGNEDKLTQAFQFIEELANHEDDRVQEVVAVTILEYLWGHEHHLLTRARRFMGGMTMGLLKKVES